MAESTVSLETPSVTGIFKYKRIMKTKKNNNNSNLYETKAFKTKHRHILLYISDGVRRTLQYYLNHSSVIYVDFGY